MDIFLVLRYNEVFHLSSILKRLLTMFFVGDRLLYRINTEDLELDPRRLGFLLITRGLTHRRTCPTTSSGGL